MIIDRLLGEISPREFTEEFFLRQPFSQPGKAAPFASLGDWSTLETILSRPDADVLVVKEGIRWEGTRLPTFAEARALHAAGHTVLARHAERCHPGLAELAAGFAADFCAPIDVHLYYTPGGSHGFGWHYDAEDVFILQTAGSKEYSLRKNTVHPWPLVETLPDDMRYPREIMPLAKCGLSAGDWLYIPHGWWHRAEAAEASISLAVGVLSPTAIDLYDFVRQRLVPSLRWRQRLPPVGQAAGLNHEVLTAQMHERFAELGAELGKLFRDEALLGDYLAWRKTSER